MSFKTFAKHFEKIVADNSPLILTAVGVAGTVSTAFLTGKASIKANDILRSEPELDTFVKKVKRVWTCYIPPVVSGLFTTTAIILANRIGTRRAAAMAAAYSISEKMFSEYKDHVIDTFGAKNEELVRMDVAQDRIYKNPLSSNEVVIIGTGKVLCYDEISGRYFESDMETLRRVQNDINQEVLQYMYSSLHDMYNKLGLPTTPYSTEIGWTMDSMLEFKFSTCLSEDNRPCISVGYSTYPVRDHI